MKYSVNSCCILLIRIVHFWLLSNRCSCIIFYNEEDSQTLVLSPNATEQISIISSNKNAKFSLVSVHSQINNITLSYDDPTKQRFIRRNRRLNGLNLGLVVFFDDNYPKRSHLYLSNENNLKLRVFIKTSQYDGFYPVPGGCNLEFPIAISPFLKLKTSELNLILDFQKASLGSNFRIIKNKQDCDFSNDKFTYEVYSYYLKENDYSEHEYMQALKRMSSVNSIETYGTKLENQVKQPKTRVNILAYRGKGVVFNVIVSFLNYKAAYSPVACYDCNLGDRNSCSLYQSWFEIFYYSICGLFGLILCLDSSKSFKFQSLYFGFLTGSSIAYILSSKFPQINLLNINLTVLIGGSLMSLLCFLIWLKCPSPKVALILSGIHFVFLITSLTFSIDKLGIYPIKYSFTYEILIAFELLIIPACSIFIDNNKLNTFCCSIFGSYMAVIAIEQFFGGSLIYIAINSINTIIYNDLYLMEANLPFQKIDYFSTVFWIFLVCLSLFLNLIIDCDLCVTRSILDSILCSFAQIKKWPFFKQSNVKKYEEIETVDNKDEDLSKYNELSRSIIGSINNLNKENEICNTSFNSNSKYSSSSKYSSPVIKRKVTGNSSSTKIDFPSTPATSKCLTPSQCSTPRFQRDRFDQFDHSNQSTPNNLLRNVVIQNAMYSANRSRF